MAGEAYVGWLAAIEEVRRVSDDRELRETMSHLQEASDKRHHIYDHLVDMRLDHEDTTPIDPAARRSDFDELSKRMTEYRAQMLDRFAYLVLQRPRSQ